ncbi:MAG: CD0415/CD1112 family protein [Lachnospiraceae bacterium]
MSGIIEKITEFIKELLLGWITSNLETMFTDVNDKVGSIAAEIGKTPENWNSGIFSMIKNLSDSVIVPIAGMIITFVLCYELISMIMEKNNMHDTDTFMFFKYFFKMLIAIYLVTHTFDIAMAIFDVANHVVNRAGGIISGSANIDVAEALKSILENGAESMGIGELLGLGLETMIVSLCMKIISVLITVILYGRMIEIYLYVSVAPIPFATFTNREWGSIGQNYVRALLALGFQGFFMMVCVAIYAVLVNTITVADNLHTAIWSVAAYTVLLCFSLFKTGTLSKSIFNAH